jgi:hypothetical protein
MGNAPRARRALRSADSVPPAPRALPSCEVSMHTAAQAFDRDGAETAAPRKLESRVGSPGRCGTPPARSALGMLPFCLAQRSDARARAHDGGERFDQPVPKPSQPREVPLEQRQPRNRQRDARAGQDHQDQTCAEQHDARPATEVSPERCAAQGSGHSLDTSSNPHAPSLAPIALHRGDTRAPPTVRGHHPPADAAERSFVAAGRVSASRAPSLRRRLVASPGAQVAVSGAR